MSQDIGMGRTCNLQVRPISLWVRVVGPVGWWSRRRCADRAVQSEAPPSSTRAPANPRLGHPSRGTQRTTVKQPEPRRCDDRLNPPRSYLRNVRPEVLEAALAKSFVSPDKAVVVA